MLKRLTPEFVDEVPELMAPGKLYVSRKFNVAMHVCPCGCGGEVTTRLGPGGWTLAENGNGTVSLRPSVGPSTQRCKSHYWITNNDVDWLPPMTTRQIAAVQAKDAAIRQAAFKAARGPWYVRLISRLLSLFRAGE